LKARTCSARESRYKTIDIHLRQEYLAARLILVHPANERFLISLTLTFDS